MLYGYADVGRSGLGNSLLPWARCFVWCREVGAEMIAPIWLRPRIGPYLRRERDKRAYHLLFRPEGGIRGLRRLGLLVLSRRQPEGEGYAASARGGIVVFSGMRDYFVPLRGRSEVIRRELVRLSRVKPWVEVRPFFAVHVRRGDFSQPISTELSEGRRNTRIPIEWYLEALRAIRRLEQRRAIVFSDGTDRELRPLLREPEVARAPVQNAVADILSMSSAGALIASGSTFSMWGSFLGQIPTLWFPGQRWQCVVAPFDGSLEPEWSAGPVPPLPIR